jgi:hypothetical protein
MVNNGLRKVRETFNRWLDFSIATPRVFYDLGILTMTVPLTPTTPDAHVLGTLIGNLLADPLPHVHTLQIDLIRPEGIIVQTSSSLDQEVQRIAETCAAVHACYTRRQDMRIFVQIPAPHSIRTIANKLSNVLDGVLLDKHCAWRVVVVWKDRMKGLWAQESKDKTNKAKLGRLEDGVGVSGAVVRGKR